MGTRLVVVGDSCGSMTPASLVLAWLEEVGGEATDGHEETPSHSPLALTLVKPPGVPMSTASSHRDQLQWLLTLYDLFCLKRMHMCVRTYAHVHVGTQVG